MIRGRKVNKTCPVCKSTFKARIADLKRGWARTCSKSCAGRHRRERSKGGSSTTLPAHTLSKRKKRILIFDDYYGEEIHPFSDDAFETWWR